MTRSITLSLITTMFVVAANIAQAQITCDFPKANPNSTMDWYGFNNHTNTGNSLISNWNAAPGQFNYNIEYTTIGAPVTTPYVLHLDAKPIGAGGTSPQWITSELMNGFNWDYNKLVWTFWIGRRGVASPPSPSRINTVWLYLDNPANINSPTLLTGYRLTWYHSGGYDRMQLVAVNSGAEDVIGDFFLRQNAGLFSEPEFGATVKIERIPEGNPTGVDVRWVVSTSTNTLTPTSVPADTDPLAASIYTKFVEVRLNDFIPALTSGHLGVWCAFDDVARAGPEFNQICFNDEGPVPVELTSFTAAYRNDVVNLNWNTATETNNYGFEVERSIEHNGLWETIAFVDGHGTSNSPHDYSYNDAPNADGASMIAYRLKQIDRDGTYEYSNTILVAIASKTTDVLYNFPNPFNPATNISFTLLQNDVVTLKVFNTAGKMVAQLHDNAKLNAGLHTVSFNGEGLPSGMYFYRLTTSLGTKSNRMILSK